MHTFAPLYIQNCFVFDILQRLDVCCRCLQNLLGCCSNQFFSMRFSRNPRARIASNSRLLPKISVWWTMIRNSVENELQKFCEIDSTTFGCRPRAPAWIRRAPPGAASRSRSSASASSGSPARARPTRSSSGRMGGRGRGGGDVCILQKPVLGCIEADVAIQRSFRSIKNKTCNFYSFL